MDTGSARESPSFLIVAVDHCLRDRVPKVKTFRDRKGHPGENRNLLKAVLYTCGFV